MATPNPLKAALRRGEPQLGLWLSLGSPMAAELAAGAGFDWVLVDMEHTVLSEGEALAHLRAARSGGPAEPLVRVPWNDAVAIKRLLDAGARSLLVPYVQDAEEAARAVAATRYPPAGRRGFSGMHRGNDFARDKGYAQHAHEDIFLAVQVESPEAVANAGAIAAVDGIDCVFVGPNDLAANMGRIGRAASPEVRALIGSVVAPVRAAGKTPGMLEFNVEQARRWLAEGFGFVAVGSDMSLLSAGIGGLLAAHGRQ
jgi:4-hydroxy-2-oxoheptanedioate aldolase